MKPDDVAKSHGTDGGGPGLPKNSMKPDDVGMSLGADGGVPTTKE